ncbi:MAG: hypothetical protein V4609_16285 [Pseudomonadota bacterium]
MTASVPDPVAARPDAPAALNLSLAPVHAPAPPSDQPSPQQRAAVLALMAHVQGAQPGAAGIAPDAQQVERLLKARPAQRLFTAEAFGDALAAELETLAPGELRGYVLATDNHTIALSLQHTRRRAGQRHPSAWRIHLHDPDRKPAHRQRIVCEPQRLRGARWRSLHAWFKTGCAPYFDASPEIATLRSWDAPAAPVAPHLHGFDKAAALRPAFLRAVMLAGDASQVRAAIAQGLAQLPGESPALLDFLQGRNGDGSALGLAMAQGRTDTVTAFVAAVGGARDEQLREASRHLLLRGAYGRLQGRTPALDAGTARLSPAGAIAYVRAVLALPRTAISDDHRADLAAAQPTEGVPLLHTLCARAPSTSEGIAPEHEVLYGIARAIAESAALTPRHKQALLAAKVSKGWLSSQTATRAALDNGHVHAAAAMVCAVIEASGDLAAKKALVASMGTPPGEVLRALNHLSEVQKVRGQWKDRIENAIGGAGAAPQPATPGTVQRR